MAPPPPPPKPKSSRVTPRGHAKKQSTTASPVVSQQQHVLSTESQQAVLNVFTQGLLVHNKHDFKPIMQEVKSHLYNRDFHRAFSKPEYLEVYALRWSAARALAYSHIFTNPSRRSLFLPKSITGQILIEPSADFASRIATKTTTTATTTPDTQYLPTRIACIGGGAGAEIVALAATTRILNLSQTLEVHAIDMADWTDPVNRLYSALTTPPAGTTGTTANNDSNTFINPGKLVVHFHHKDILDSCSSSSITVREEEDKRGKEQPMITSTTANQSTGVQPASVATDADANAQHMQQSQDVATTDNTTTAATTTTTAITTDNDNDKTDLQKILSQTNICTIMFTLNELFTTSIPKTTAMLLHLTNIMKPQSHLVVVDSPGSYSEIQLGPKLKEQKTSEDGNLDSLSPKTTTPPPIQGSGLEQTKKTKKYPMKWLLDHTLLEMAGEEKWMKIEGEDSVWFRTGDPKSSHQKKSSALNYPLELENCRYQIHVYRRL